jgi:trehalose 6-phosphate phosphatase
MSDTKLAHVLEEPARTVLCLDFDGTLTHIVNDPGKAQPISGIIPRLTQLATRLARVAVISGRPVDFLQKQLPVPGVHYLGLYGIEELVDGQVTVKPEAAEKEPVIAEIVEQLKAHPLVVKSGAYIEDKRYSVVIHVRRVADPQAWQGPLGELADKVARDHGLNVATGKMVWEIKTLANKGSALRDIVERADANSVIVIGDDEGDIPAFQAARDLSDSDRLNSLCVAVQSAEAPEDLLAIADITVDGPGEVLSLLDCISAMTKP